MGGGGRAFGNASQMSVFQIRQAVLVGLSAHFCSWACWGWFFMEKKMYISRYNVFTYNIMFSKCLGRCYWMDGIGWVWMTISELGRCSQLGLLRLGFAAGLTGLGFSQQKTCITVNAIHLYTFLWLKGSKNESISHYLIQHNLR